MDYKQLVESLIEAVIKENGSDIHLAEGEHPVIRVHGLLHYLESMSVLSSEDMKEILNILLSPKQVEEFLKNKEIDFSYETSKSRF